MADVFKKIRGLIGTVGTLFQFGFDQAQIKAQGASTLDFRDKDDAAFAIVRVAAPVGDNDAVTKLYADQLTKPLIVSRQADTSGGLPANTAQRGFVVVTTAGSGAVLGDVLFDDGTGVGTMTILGGGPQEGRAIAVTDALTGGTITFDTDSIYLWDADGTTWVKIGDVGAVTGATRVIAVPFDFNDVGTPVDSTAQVPASSVITRSVTRITTAFDDAATAVALGNSTTANLVQLTSDNKPDKLGQYQVDEIIPWGGVADEARVSVTGGTPTTGVGIAYFFYAVPNA